MNPDFEDLLRALSVARAEYLVIGGYAVSFHTEPRSTKDLGVWVRPTTANARKVMAALKSFGAPLANLRLCRHPFRAFTGAATLKVQDAAAVPAHARVLSAPSPARPRYYVTR